ncbi:MAG: NAD(P)/FAD-dependent oxidoreductase [Candidatus Edwardsbacteria bacterium]|nr:NAD(P)/FAD-dependent oxidoreductase [Candidatus Edwardsbacteria bacterium]
MPQSKTVSVIGGGPSGMIAAIAAAREGAAVRLWEKNGSLGRKLLATGNGRCNFTNRDLSLSHFHGGSPDLVDLALSRFDGKQTMEFFRGLGVEHYYDEKGRCFPAPNEAGSVLFALEQEMARLNVEMNTRCEIVSVKRTNDGFAISQRGRSHECDAIVIACGGAAAPQFGSNGNGFELAKQMGHHIIPIRPALVPFELSGNWHHKLQGVRRDMTLTVILDDGSADQYTDEGLFTHYGLSGPLALRASRELGERGIACSLNFLPGQNAETVSAALRQRVRLLPERKACELLTGWLPAKVGQMLVRETRIAPDAMASDIPAGELDTLAKNMTDFPFSVKSLRGLKEAQVTAGGIDCAEIDCRAMRSKLVPGLFFCGEVVDVDGDSGGYNLQWCWSSGWVAGRSAVGAVS